VEEKWNGQKTCTLLYFFALVVNRQETEESIPQCIKRTAWQAFRQKKKLEQKLCIDYSNSISFLLFKPSCPQLDVCAISLLTPSLPDVISLLRQVE
jgi:hypothetical protein